MHTYIHLDIHTICAYTVYLYIDTHYFMKNNAQNVFHVVPVTVQGVPDPGAVAVAEAFAALAEAFK